MTLMTCANTCCQCGDRPATRTSGQGEPLCHRCWVEDGMYDPGQGVEPTERDRAVYAARAPRD